MSDLVFQISIQPTVYNSNREQGKERKFFQPSH